MTCWQVKFLLDRYVYFYIINEFLRKEGYDYFPCFISYLTDLQCLR